MFKKLLIAIFGHPDVSKIGLVIRGFFLALGASSIGALLYLLNQWTNGIEIDWSVAKQIFIFNVVPVLTLWFTALKTWLDSQSKVSVEQFNRAVEIGISLPQGSSPSDAVAIFNREQVEADQVAAFAGGKSLALDQIPIPGHEDKV